MKNIKLSLIILPLLATVSSCERVIDIKTENGSGKVVIEANVTDVTGTQTIKISKNVLFTNTNTYPAVNGATVLLTDAAGNNYPFTETTSGTYVNTQLIGRSGTSYKMMVVTAGINYSASSALPIKVVMDSLTSKNSAISSGSNPDKEISVHYKDPAGAANYYRFVMFVNGIQIKSVFAFDDEFNDGRTINLNLRQNEIDVYAGDTVTVEMQCIDKAVYLYWFTLSRQGNNGPGGSVTPADPPTNITPVSLGYFSAHTTQIKTITVK